MQYSKKVLDHFMHPHNIGEIKDADSVATEGSPACGDQVTLFLKVNPDTKIIDDIKFQSYGCASNIATGSIITEMAKGKSLDEAKKIDWKSAAAELDGLPPQKMHCSVLAVDTLRTAIQNYELKNNLIEKEVISKTTIVKELKNIIHPLSGEDIISMKLVKYAGFENGIAIIDLDIPSFDQYRDNIAEEIKEHLEKFEEINDIKITM